VSRPVAVIDNEQETFPLEFRSEGPAEKLQGLVLSGEWIVVERLVRDVGDVGQSRSACYRAVSRTGGISAFVKAFDFRFDDQLGDTNRLERNVREFNHEKNVHEHCRDLTRVTRIYGHGHVIVDEQAVHFIVCEYADHSFRSKQPPGETAILVSDRLDGLKKIALAILQLHWVGVAHQDVKPSNAVCFNDDVVKLTDLGSSSCVHLPAPPHDANRLVGQPNYAPYELLYESTQLPSRQRSRYACDAYLLGNLIFTSFVGHSLTVIALHWLDESMWHTSGNVSYEDVLPDLISAHSSIVPDFLNEFVPDEIFQDLCSLIMSLCHPDPSQRGLSKWISGGERHLDLNRCVGTLNTLCQRAKFYEQKKRRNLDSSSVR